MSNTELQSANVDVTVVSNLKHGILWRAAKKMGSQAALAKALGVEQIRVSQWIRLTRVPHFDRMHAHTLERLKSSVQEVLGVSIYEVWPEQLIKILELHGPPRQLELSRSLDVIAIQSERLLLPSPERVALREELREQTQMMLQRMDHRQAQIVSLRWGLDGTPKTLGEVAQIVHLTRERVRQIENKALRRLRAIWPRFYDAQGVLADLQRSD